jgi:flagellar biosynthesis/type III secretory pathway chaperone
MTAERPTIDGAVPVQASHIVALTARLAELLADEIDILADMRIQDLTPLQEEKLQLVEALELHKRYIVQCPEIVETFSDEDRENLLTVSEIFQSILQDNHQRLLIAKNVNEIVRQAIADTLAEMNPLNGYDGCGLIEGPDGLPPVSLNQQI